MKEHLVQVYILVEVEAYVLIKGPKSQALDKAKDLVAGNLEVTDCPQLAEGYTTDVTLHTDFDTDFEQED